ncbi:hypothetical protein [Streptomyces sp. NPDC127098]|uniref:hypothetical protein n=1 Tax=Streptomyces sp. NPDC127098 TaxID=3347137 RepID=UPI003660C52D
MSRLLQWGRAIAERTQGRYTDRGAGFVEYAGLLLLIAGIVVVVLSLGLDQQIGNFIQTQVNRVLGG